MSKTMSNETKRDVVLQIAKENRDFRVYDPEGCEPKELIEQDYQDWIREYDAALPDDLPVLPKAVSKWLTWCKRKHHSLKDALDGETRVSEDVFVSAWLLGVWRVEETGKIVKLEA